MRTGCRATAPSTARSWRTGSGNFVWPRGNVGAVIEVKTTGRVIDGYRWIPMKVAGSIPSPMGEQQAAAEVSQWEQLRSCTDLTP